MLHTPNLVEKQQHIDTLKIKMVKVGTQTQAELTATEKKTIFD